MKRLVLALVATSTLAIATTANADTVFTETDAWNMINAANGDISVAKCEFIEAGGEPEVFAQVAQIFLANGGQF